jgi:O-antigen ligase
MGFFEWPNSLADYMAIALPLGIMPALFGGVHGRVRALILYIAGPIMLAALFLSGSREAWGAILAATLFLGLTVERRLLRAFLRVILPGLVIAALLYQPFLGRLAGTFQDSGRLRFFQASVPVITGHPWLGVGPGQFGGHVALITNSPLYLQYDLTELFSEISTQQIDMFWTHLLAEFGLLGTAAYVAAIAACFMHGRRAYRAAVEPRQKAMLLGLLYAIPVGVFVSFVSAFLEATNSATLFWGLMGMLCVLASSGARDIGAKAAGHGG